MNDELNPEERKILAKFERGEVRRVSDIGRETAIARDAARATFTKTRRVNLRVTERDFALAHARALEEGLPYQTLLSSVIHKYLTGRLIERSR
ncbi:MAG: antitoxin [Gemmatimonadetes bacterium]|nr:antitoxin [Gemmatimonadota bacterium]